MANVPPIPKRISSIKFGLMSPKEIRKMSATPLSRLTLMMTTGFHDMGLMDTNSGY